MIQSYKDLQVWQLSRNLVKEVYLLSGGFPKTEVYGLTAQLRRAAISVPSNIAEGHSRCGRRDYANFVAIAIGSCAEMETQILLAVDLGFCSIEQTEFLLQSVEQLQKMLHRLRQSLGFATDDLKSQLKLASSSPNPNA
jgi:four helix bundle protein